MIVWIIGSLLSLSNAFFSDFNNEMNTVRRDLEEVFSARYTNDCDHPFFSFSRSLNPFIDRCNDNKDETKSRLETRETKEYLTKQIDFGVDDTNKALLKFLRSNDIQQKFSYMQNLFHLEEEIFDEIRSFILKGRGDESESEARLKFLDKLFKQTQTDDSSTEPSNRRISENSEANPSTEDLRQTLEEIVEIIHKNNNTQTANIANFKNIVQSNVTSVVKVNRQVITEWTEEESVRNEKIQDKINKDLPTSFKDIATNIFKKSDQDKREKQDVKTEIQNDQLNNLEKFESGFLNSPDSVPKYFSSLDDLEPKDEAAEAEALENAQRLIEADQYTKMFMSSVHNNPDMEVQDVFNISDRFNFG